MSKDAEEKAAHGMSLLEEIDQHIPKSDKGFKTPGLLSRLNAGDLSKRDQIRRLLNELDLANEILEEFYVHKKGKVICIERR